MATDFTGAKLAYIFNGQLLVYKRDNYSHIPFPGRWDFPGGGREGGESPEACVLRELEEEFAITLPASRLIYKKQVANHTNNGNAFFFVAEGMRSEIDAIVFSDEGQYWQLMPIMDYVCHPQAVAALVDRLNGYLAAENG